MTISSSISEKAAKICYLEIPAPNLEKSGSFYKSVFGWDVKPSNLSDEPYWIFSTGEAELEGGLDPKRAVQKDGGVILYLKVSDISDRLAAVSRAGGGVVRDKFPVGGEHGFAAIITDPSGNQIGLWSKD